jgi:hypothetical protein
VFGLQASVDVGQEHLDDPARVADPSRAAGVVGDLLVQSPATRAVNTSTSP